jgi:hypothetical protein
MSAARPLALAAALLMGAPGLATPPGDNMVWVGLCDPTHPGARIPLPLDRPGDQAPGKACHAACAVPRGRR